MTKIIIITDDGRSKKNNKKSKKKKKKAIDQDIDSPIKEENWDFSKIGRRMMKDE
jgi:hypothetical protein|tara:strand:- start:180 stop:344 length:165 start_codon:yes stop_codon:yes gene_type:complete